MNDRSRTTKRRDYMLPDTKQALVNGSINLRSFFFCSMLYGRALWSVRLLYSTFYAVFRCSTVLYYS